MKMILNVLLKIGNFIIICFSIIVHSFKKIIFIKHKDKCQESLIDHVEGLERRLNYSTKNLINKDNNKSSYRKNIQNNYSPQKQYKKTYPTTKQTQINRKSNIKSNGFSKYITRKNIVYLASGLCIIVAFIFIGSLISNSNAKENDVNKAKPAVALQYSSEDNTYSDNNTDKEQLNSPTPEVSALSSENMAVLNDSKSNDTKVNSENIPTAPPTPTPTTKPTSTPISSPTVSSSPHKVDDDLMLHLEDTHEEVAKVQERLMELHYMDEDEPTTYYGVVTNYAVQLFQRNHKLSVDGVAGASTIRLLYSDEAKPYMVRKGDKGTDIRQIQKRLTELGYLKSKSRDSRFDEDTDLAVRQFQGRNKLSQDGIVGYNTTQVLFNGDAKPAKTYKKPSKPDTSNNNSDDDDDGGGETGAPSAQKFVNYAKSLLGKGIPYVWGGKSKSGLDCSGFVYYSLNRSGYKTGYRTSGAWAKSNFKTISKMSSLKVGDVVCFQGHVGIYIGGGNMIDSSSSKNGIRTTNIKSSNYWNRKWICGKRVFN